MVRWCTLTTLLLVTLTGPNVGRAQAPPSDPGVTHTAWQAAGPGKVKQKPAAYGDVGPIPAGPGRMIYRELPDDTGWIYEDTPLERKLKDAFRHSYFRMEYLLWDVSDPGNNVLGAPTAILNLDQLSPNDPSDPNYPSTVDPTLTLQQQYVFQPYRDDVLTPFQVSNPIDGNTSLISVVAPSLQDVQINENNGIRATFGLPVWNGGTFEASIFALQSSTSQQGRQPIPRFDNSYDSDGDAVFIAPGTVNTGSSGTITVPNTAANEVFIGTGIGEFDRNGNGLVIDVVNDFEAFATPILINGGVPTPNRTPPNDPTSGQSIDPTPFLWPSIRQPLGGLQTVVTPDGTVLIDPRGRGDNFRIVWAIRNPDPVDRLVNPFLNTYQAALKTSVWGTEANWIFADGLDNNAGLTIKPMAGFRYAYFAEDLRQSGAYTFVSTNPINNQLIDNTINRKIDSTTINNLYGPQLGLRAEVNSRWFTIGAQPKVMMGLNTYKANLATANVLRPSDAEMIRLGLVDPSLSPAEQFLAAGDVDQNITENASTFGVVGDLEIYTRVRLTDYLHGFVGYNFMWAGMITRPADNIIYNANTVQIDPDADPNDTNLATRLDSDFKLKVDYSGAIIQGLTLGAELRY